MSKQREKMQVRFRVLRVVLAGLAVLGVGLLAGRWTRMVVEACSPPPSYPSTDIFLNMDTEEGSYTLEPNYASYAVGTQVEMTATGKVYEDYDYVLDYWEGLPVADFPDGPGGPGTSSANPVTTTVTTCNPNLPFPESGQKRPRWVKRFLLLTLKSGQGQIDPSWGFFKKDTYVTMTATPAAGWQFDHWEFALTGTQNPKNLYMNSPKLVKAVFVPVSTVTVGLASITPVTIAEGGSTNLTLNASTGTHSGFTVDLSVGVCSPNASTEDYSVPSQVVFPPNTPSVAVNVSAVQDLVDEHDECFTVNLSQISAGTANIDPAAASVQATIQDDDASPALSFELETASVAESDGTAHIKVLLSNPSSEAISLDFDVDGTATPGLLDDYLITESPMSIPAGSPDASIDVVIANDHVEESDETVVVTLLSATCPTLSASIGSPVTHTLTIVDTGGPPSAEFSAAPVSGAAPLTVTFTDQSADNGSAITGWLWDFGDTGTSTLQNPEHTYTSAGTYPVTLTVTNANG
ncbi:MAG: PKD domain-containing protein, partial [Candidatus Hydrogenedentes bacterium]|nr:PKD domain-containing protein [Candidatus Hydrogenedentota bacterium]